MSFFPQGSGRYSPMAGPLHQSMGFTEANTTKSTSGCWISYSYDSCYEVSADDTACCLMYRTDQCMSRAINYLFPIQDCELPGACCGSLGKTAVHLACSPLYCVTCVLATLGGGDKDYN